MINFLIYDFLKYFAFERGIPSRSLLSKIFGLIEKKKMEVLLIEFANYFLKQNTEHIIALDGR